MNWTNDTIPQVFLEEESRFSDFSLTGDIFSNVEPVLDSFGDFKILIPAILIAGTFGAFFLRHEDITVPTFLFILLSFTLRDFIPSDWMPFIVASVGISIAAMVYTYFRGVRNG